MATETQTVDSVVGKVVGVGLVTERATELLMKILMVVFARLQAENAVQKAVLEACKLWISFFLAFAFAIATCLISGASVLEESNTVSGPIVTGLLAAFVSMYEHQAIQLAFRGHQALKGSNVPREGQPAMIGVPPVKERKV